MDSTYSRTEPIILLSLVIAALAISLVSPHDYFTWFLETAPVIIGIPVLVLTYGRFPLTPLACRLLFIHALILIIGGHYTYARVPFGYMLQDFFELSRNPYDRIGHFAQGFVPAILAREIIRRKLPELKQGWVFFFVVCFCLSLSAFYELIEWWAAVAFGDSAESFLGTQGDVWDTQWDMFLALCGALCANLFLSGIHENQLKKTD